MSSHLERDIFGGSDSELSSEEEDLHEERLDRHRASPPPTQPASESSGESGDEYVQEKQFKKKDKRREDEPVRIVQRKRKRRQRQHTREPEPEIEKVLTPAEEKRKEREQKIEEIIKPKKSNRTKKRKKDADEEMLDRFADEEVSQLREDMLKAAAEDDDANREKLPATAKLKLLPRVKEVLQKSSLAQSIMDNNLLEGVRRWLEPLPDRSLPALNIQSFLFEQLSKMYIDTNSLKESGLGRVILFYTKCKRVQTSIARLANDLVAAWSRPIIKRSSSYRDKLVPVVPRNDDAAVPRSTAHPARLNTILAQMREEDKRRVRKNAVQIPTADMRNYTVAPRDGLSLQRSNTSVVNDIERRKKAAERLRSVLRKMPSKN